MSKGNVPQVFRSLEKIKPLYDWTYKVLMFICKILLIGDILITCWVVLARYIHAIPAPTWGEEVILTLMAYMAVLSAALAIRKNAHIRMTSFDMYLPKTAIKVLDVISDLAVLGLAFVMLIVGMQYAIEIGSKGFYTSMPGLSKFWQYFPVPLAGIAMIIFQLEALYEHIKLFFVDEEESGKEEKK